jgi:hypothetical protein
MIEHAPAIGPNAPGRNHSETTSLESPKATLAQSVTAP